MDETWRAIFQQDVVDSHIKEFSKEGWKKAMASLSKDRKAREKKNEEYLGLSYITGDLLPDRVTRKEPAKY